MNSVTPAASARSDSSQAPAADISVFDLSAMSVADRDALTVRSEADLGPFLEGAQKIIDDVRTGGDEAVARFGRALDKADLSAAALRASPEEFAAAEGAVASDVVDAIRYAAESIRIFHERQMPEPMWLDEVRPGVLAGERTAPIPSVACYVPRGKGAFP
ncbi:MAG: histidinol dehydrogenase, partial [Pseudomonadota bacterium]